MRRPRFLLPLLVPLLFATLYLAWGPAPTVFPDSYRYIRAAEVHRGATPQEAHRTALNAFCVSRADGRARERSLQPLAAPRHVLARDIADACRAKWRTADDLTTSDPRFQAIFDARWGYPWLLAGSIQLAGPLAGPKILSAGVLGVAMLLTYLLLRSAGTTRRAAVAGQAVLLATPLGWWTLQPLTEGLVLCAALGAAWAFHRLARDGTKRSHGLAAAGLLASVGLCFWVRYSTALLLAGALAVAAIVLAAYRRRRGRRTPGTGRLLGTTVTAALATGAAVTLAGLPSTQTTLQDTYTLHFKHPLVDDPWARLARSNVQFWTDWLQQQLTHPAFLLLTAAALYACARRNRVLGLTACAIAAVGLAQAAAHPLPAEAERLGCLMWLPVVLGLPLLLSSRERLPKGRARHTPATGEQP
ncbi:glycosyltransferase family 39 protein [Streptomyces sp. NPDC001941]|uniref:glycosyltransferase family 39 protein n=1 Tax=Streptomyces sp. NPDC001941 TaxID=3154659 RepID=UPI00332F7607